MNREQIQNFLGARYPGFKKLMTDFIEPLFDGADIDDNEGASQLTDDIKNLADRSGIKDVKLCAEITPSFSTVRVYDVTVKDNVLLRRNRVTVQQLVRRIVGGNGAFIAFHHEREQSEWRFSFCQKFAGETTSAKRHTFLVGPGQNLRTVTENFMRLYDTLMENGGLEEKDYVQCFDVESLSKEFFDKYKAHYEKFCSYVTEAKDRDATKLYDAFGNDDKRVRDYVKKMMGRLVFLQFLQKKGWLGVPVGGKWGDGDRAFLQNLFANATPLQQADFLDAILEPMFFNALNTDNTHKGDVFDTGVKAYGDRGKVRIPYLNGGLFTNDDEDDFKSVFPARFFSDAKHKEDPDPAKYGLLDFFAQYNFTIDENDPTEAEVGVDPEMLSCIFENLLEDNKDKGAFYTPKEIVEYMCRQSLVAYLQTGVPEKEHASIAEFAKTYDSGKLAGKLAATIDRKLKEVKICDPAIGSGAFPMGMLRELFFCRAALGDPLAETPAELKKNIIQNSIYGVDIEKGAVDIARLRFWLSLVVDEPTPHALPNLDFKIMQGNSLLENYKGVPLDSLLFDKTVNPKKAKQGRFAFDKRETYSQGELAFGGQSASDVITSLMKEYYSTDKRDRKQRILDDINAQVKGYIKDQIGNSALHAEIDALECQNNKFFLWHTWFADVFERGGFDIVIANPPYIKELDNAKVFDEIKGSDFWKKYHQGKMDYWFFFLHKSIEITKKDSIINFITSRYWLNSSGAKKIINHIDQELSVVQIVDIGSLKVFENVVGNHMIAIYKKSTNDDCLYRIVEDDIKNLTNNKFLDERIISRQKLIVAKNDCCEIRLEDDIESTIMHHLDCYYSPNLFTVTQGIVENPSLLTKKCIENLGGAGFDVSQFSVGDEVFVVSANTMETCHFSQEELKLFKPYHTPSELYRYYYDKGVSRYLIYSTKDQATTKSQSLWYQAVHPIQTCLKNK